MIGFLLALVACDAPSSDRARYLEAAQHPNDPAPCLAIVNHTLSAECLALTAPAQARTDPEAAMERCAMIPPESLWRGECAFLVSDALVAKGPQAVEICKQAGDFADRCLGHAFGREGRALLATHPRGQERAATQVLREMAGVYFSDEDLITRKVHDLLIQHVAGRDPGIPFSAEHCGALPRKMCSAALALRIREEMSRSRQPLSALCAEGVAPRAIGLSGWSEAFEPMGRRVVAEICAQPQRR